MGQSWAFTIRLTEYYDYPSKVGQQKGESRAESRPSVCRKHRVSNLRRVAIIIDKINRMNKIDLLLRKPLFLLPRCRSRLQASNHPAGNGNEWLLHPQALAEVDNIGRQAIEALNVFHGSVVPAGDVV